MRHMFRRLAAVLCGCGLALSLVCSTAIGAFAEQVSDDYTAGFVLPSGRTVGEFERALSDINSENSGSFGAAAVGVWADGETLYAGHFGHTDVQNGIPADDTSVYEWGSITKTLIWVSAMQLWERGELDLERDVREYLPDGFFQYLSYDDPITMLNLMNHDAGWQETTRPIEVKSESDILPLGEALQAIEPAQINRPGEVVAYSNYGAAVGGYVIECVTGQDFCEYVREHIFEPLGMEHTALSPAHTDNSWVSEKRKSMHSYKLTFGDLIDLGTMLEYVPAYPAGAATGTLDDLMTYGKALMDETAPLFDDPDTQKMMFSGTHFYGESDVPTCAHGFWVTEYADRAFGHTGATVFGQADLELDFESGVGAAVMINQYRGNEFMGTAQSLALGEMPPDKYGTPSGEKLTLDGYYLVSRDIYSGMMSFSAYFGGTKGGVFGEPEDLGNGLYQLRGKSDIDPGQETAVLVGVKNSAKGLTIEQPSAELFRDRYFIPKLGLLTLYVLGGLGAVYMLLIRGKLKKHGKLTPYSGSAFVTAGQISGVISALLLIISYVIYSQNTGGIPYAAAAFNGIMQAVCAGVSGISATGAAVSLISGKRKAKAPCLYTIITSLLLVISVIYFGMYKYR